MPILNLNHVSLYYEEFGGDDAISSRRSSLSTAISTIPRIWRTAAAFMPSSSEFGAMPLLHGHRGPGRRLV